MTKRVLILSQSDRWHKLEDLGARIVRWLGRLEGVETETCHDKAALAGGQLDGYDVCVLCATMSGLTAEQERAVVDFVAGGRSLVGIHSATVVDEERTAYIDLIGGRFTHHSPYHEFEVRVVGQGHPITAGVGDFKVQDELYVLDRAPEGAQVLATALWEDQAQPLVYVKKHGKGQIVYNALGHDDAAFDHPAFQKLVVQGIEWACQEAR